MPEKGWKTLTVKEELAAWIKEKAKAAGLTVNDYLERELRGTGGKVVVRQAVKHHSRLSRVMLPKDWEGKTVRCVLVEDVEGES